MEESGKEERRRDLLHRRRMMDPEAWRRKSEAAGEFLKRLEPLKQALRVHCYVSMESEMELSTLAILEWLCSEQKEVYIPYIEGGRMRSARYLPGHRFKERQAGPPVPEPLILSDEVCFDAVVVPLVGTDRMGVRIGYGKGWYDRFFAALLEAGVRPVRIGLCFGFQVLSELHPDSWDQHLDIVVTENGIINCA